jgi:hypothetical protein
MILILSQSAMEPTTETVMDWMAALGGRCLRLPGEGSDGGAALRVPLDAGRMELSIEANGVDLPLAEIGTVWLRRWLVAQLTTDGSARSYGIRRRLPLESRLRSGFSFSRFSPRLWPDRPGAASLNKLDVLTRAARAGLATPETLVTTEREDLRRFCRERDAVLTEPIGRVSLLIEGESSQLFFSEALDAAAVDTLPDRFAPSLFQERLAQELGIRVYYLAGEIHALAVFAKSTAPYRLAAQTAERIRRLMDDLGWTAGTLDLLQASDGREVFLGAHPVGRLGMVSKPCNYRLDKKLAELLLTQAAHR